MSEMHAVSLNFWTIYIWVLKLKKATIWILKLLSLFTRSPKPAMPSSAADVGVPQWQPNTVARANFFLKKIYTISLSHSWLLSLSEQTEQGSVSRLLTMDSVNI